MVNLKQLNQQKGQSVTMFFTLFLNKSENDKPQLQGDDYQRDSLSVQDLSVFVV